MANHCFVLHQSYRQKKWSLKNCKDNKFSKIHNCTPSQSSSVPPILYMLCYLYFLLIFWVVILMFHSIWWLFPMFKFWYISWHSSFIRRRLLLVFIRQWCRFIYWAGLLLSTTVVVYDFCVTNCVRGWQMLILKIVGSVIAGSYTTLLTHTTLKAKSLTPYLQWPIETAHY